MAESSRPNAVPPSQDRRALVRRQFGRDVPCRVVHMERQDARWARVKDISAGGIGLLVSSPFDTGTPVVVELADSSGQRQFSVLAQVVYARRLGDGTWGLGCAFAERLNDAELQALLA